LARQCHWQQCADAPCARENRLLRQDLFADTAQALSSEAAQSTGFAGLDQLLPGGGWPTKGLIEIIGRHKAIGELQLLMPLLRTRSQQKTSHCSGLHRLMPCMALLWHSPASISATVLITDCP